jgi:hypothetical protein
MEQCASQIEASVFADLCRLRSRNDHLIRLLYSDCLAIFRGRECRGSVGRLIPVHVSFPRAISGKQNDEKQTNTVVLTTFQTSLIPRPENLMGHISMVGALLFKRVVWEVNFLSLSRFKEYAHGSKSQIASKAMSQPASSARVYVV